MQPRKTFRKRLLKAQQIWNAKFPSSKKRGRSLLAGHPPDSVELGLLDDPEDEGQASGAGAGPTSVGAERGGAGAAPPAWGMAAQ